MTHLPASYNRLNKAQARAIRARRDASSLMDKNPSFAKRISKIFRHHKNKIKTKTVTSLMKFHPTKGWRGVGR